MSVDRNALGSFLRARRELVRPEEVGIDVQARRRVAGLRREELSVLAGISLDYYVRLERGRDRRPSPAVVDALARALRLDERLTDHLRTLATGGAAPGGGPEIEAVSPRLERLLASWEHQPALVLGRRLDVLAANRLAEFLHPGSSRAPTSRGSSSSTTAHRIATATGRPRPSTRRRPSADRGRRSRGPAARGPRG